MHLRVNKGGKLARFPDCENGVPPFFAKDANVPEVDAVISCGFNRGAGKPGILNLLRGESGEGSTPFREEKGAAVPVNFVGIGCPQHGASSELCLEKGLKCDAIDTVDYGLCRDPALRSFNPLVRGTRSATERASHPGSPGKFGGLSISCFSIVRP